MNSTRLPLEMTDANLRERIARYSSFKKINLKQIQNTRAKATDIVQRGIGNCYFLSALGSILEKNPNFIDQVLKVKTERDASGNERVWVEVSFYDVEDPTKIHIYKIEPTKVLSYSPFKRNAHKHAAIYLLEKAYAIHRMVTEKDIYLPDTAHIIGILKDNNLDSKKAFSILHKQKMRRGKRPIKLDDFKTVKTKGVAYLKAAEEIVRVLEAEKQDAAKAFRKLKAKKFKINGIDVTLQDVKYVENLVKNNQFLFPEDVDAIKRALNEASDDSDEAFKRLDGECEVSGKRVSLADVQECKKIYLENKSDYISALTSGHADRAYASLLGHPVKAQPIQQDISLEDLLTGFVPDVATNIEIMVELQKLNTASESDIKFDKITSRLKENSKTILKRIFGENLNDHQREICYFLSIINSQFYIKAAHLLVALKPEKKPSEAKDVHQELKNLFSDALKNAHDIPNEVNESLQFKLNTFIEKEIPHKRGMNKYTTPQEETFEHIKRELQKGQILSLSTKKNVGSNSGSRLFSPANEPRSKGLAGGHVYQIINCYERNGTKMVLVKNPWGVYVRDYEYKTKTIGGKKVDVLSPVAKLQLNGFSFFYRMKNQIRYLFGLKKTKQDNLRADPITNAAIPMPHVSSKEFEKNGYFELTLEDVAKRCDAIQSTDHKIEIKPSTPTRNRKLMVSYLNIIATLAGMPESVRTNRATSAAFESTMSMLRASQSRPELNEDANSILAMYQFLTGRPEQADIALKRVGSAWELDDAILHLQRHYQAEITGLGMLDTFLSEAKRTMMMSK